MHVPPRLDVLAGLLPLANTAHGYQLPFISCANRSAIG